VFATYKAWQLFVPHTAPGDQLQVKIVKVLKQYAFGIAVKMKHQPHAG